MVETLTLMRIRLGLDAAEGWRDKDFSFTDRSSFVVMKERRIRAALTNDRHFVQAGFQTYTQE